MRSFLTPVVLAILAALSALGCTFEEPKISAHESGTVSPQRSPHVTVTFTGDAWPSPYATIRFQFSSVPVEAETRVTVIPDDSEQSPVSIVLPQDNEVEWTPDFRDCERGAACEVGFTLEVEEITPRGEPWNVSVDVNATSVRVNNGPFPEGSSIQIAFDD